MVIVFKDPDTYYEYVSNFYAEAGEFAMSSGMFLNHGFGHFITVEAEMHAIEPVIAHELTHAFVAHLPIPNWLNEGLAVNTEKRISVVGPELHTPREMHEKHQKYWTEEKIQLFWSGDSFFVGDEGNMLSYDLARILVEQFSSEWTCFQKFVNAATYQDAGFASAKEYFDIELGKMVAVLFEFDPTPNWNPQGPSRPHLAEGRRS